MENEKEIISQKSNNGIGIVNFFEGKNILVTGATGFLAKALIEKMLRTTPKVNKIYLLIRAKDKEAAFLRLKNEVNYGVRIIQNLEEMHGESYRLFIKNKLVPIVGNIYEPNLGMDIIISQKIAQEIDLIIDSAAITTFDERYDLALDANVNGPYQLMMFAKKCKKLKLLMHYSTAYANGEREGIILEKPFTMGESITKEKITSISPFIEFPSLDVENEMGLISKLKKNIKNNCLDQIMKDLGLERTIDPLIYFYQKGDLPCILGDPNGLVDLVPVDMVVNATMAAIAKYGYLQNPELNIYHLTSTFTNPVSFSQIFDYFYDFFKLFPFVNSKGDTIEVKKVRFFDKISDFENYIWEVLSKQHEVQDEKEVAKIQMRFKRKVKYLKHITKLYEPYMFYKGWFHNGNMQKLMGDMSEEEKISFEIDVTKINWRNYFVKTHIPGLQKYVLQGKKIN
ncbi:hypothetical protein T459_22373 [Capsicum annuum]|uniref:Fatty acyl-CoA reductase n=1 Tax=Capsicum annuum TaxID=4072 RepID=A0A2G2YPC5_CAPAN|nr:hypothetical protein T459_22373 [Capsicum annuum]